MSELLINVEGKDGAFADLESSVDGGMGELFRIASLDGGMESGRPSVALAIRLPDGRVIVAETTLRLFQLAAAALTGKYGDLTGTKATVVLE